MHQPGEGFEGPAEHVLTHPDHVEAVARQPQDAGGDLVLPGAHPPGGQGQSGAGLALPERGLGAPMLQPDRRLAQRPLHRGHQPLGPMREDVIGGAPEQGVYRTLLTQRAGDEDEWNVRVRPQSLLETPPGWPPAGPRAPRRHARACHA